MRALLDHAAVSDAAILAALQTFKGDVERVILSFVETPDETLPEPSSIDRKGKQKMDQDDDEDKDEDDDELFEQIDENTEMDGGLALSDSEESSTEALSDPEAAHEEEEPENASHSAASSESEDAAYISGSDDEIDSWFEQPDLAHIRAQRQAPVAPDLFTKQLQEEADKEFAMALQRELSGARGPSNSSVYYNAQSSPFARLAATSESDKTTPWNFSHFQSKSDAEKRREEWRAKAAQPHQSAQIIENPALAQFLKEQDERNTMKIMHADDAPQSGMRVKAGPRLHTVLQELKKIEQEIRIFNEKKVALSQSSTAPEAVVQPKSRRGKHRSKFLEEVGLQQRMRSALRRSQEQSAETLAESGEFVPREDLSEDLIQLTDYAAQLAQLPAPIPLPDCLSIQDEEIASVQTTLGPSRVTLSDSVPRRVAIFLQEPTFLRQKGPEQELQTFAFPKPLRLVLIFTLPSRYPNPSAPIVDIAIRSASLNLTRQINIELVNDLTTFLVSRSVRRVLNGSASDSLIDPLPILELVELAETWLESTPAVAACAKAARASLVAHESSNFAGSDYSESLHHILAPDFRVMSTDDILAQRENAITRAFDGMTKSAPNLTIAAVRVLLRAFSWDEDSLLARWSSTQHLPSERDNLLAEAGIMKHQAFRVGNDRDEREQILSRGSWECPGCYDDFDSTDHAVTLPCGHFFCRDCMTNYLKLQISEGGTGTAITGREAINCPGHKCKFYVDSITLAALVDPDMYSRYISYVTNAYVEKNPHVCWCPSGRGCEFAIATDMDNTRMVGCKCGYVFCFSCKAEGHWPAACDELKWFRDTNPTAREMDLQEEENRSVEWILSHTQDCPKCRVNIQKNGGCNHMSCWSCNHNYCWVCLSDWSPSHYSCKALKKRDANTGAEELVFKADSNLGFRSIWHINAHNKTMDLNLKNRLIREIGALIKTQRIAANVTVCEAILRAIEYLFLCRHIILTTSIVGMFMIQHRVGGSNQLKPELRRLSADISFMHGMLGRPLKSLTAQDINPCIGAIKSSIRNLMHVMGRYRLQLKERELKHGPIEIEKPPQSDPPRKA